MVNRYTAVAGQEFNSWTTISPEGRSNWKCRCVCGKVEVHFTRSLHLGLIRSCGCQKIENCRAGATKHGHYSGGRTDPTYQSWLNMRHRCLNPKQKNYHRYGDRGITICDRWGSYDNFLADMGPKPDKLTLERRNNDLGYGPDNCEWATQRDQQANRKGALGVKNWKRIVLRLLMGENPNDLASEYGVGRGTILIAEKRLRDRGIPIPTLPSDPDHP